MSAVLKASRYFQVHKDDDHPMGCSWYFRISGGKPVGPFNELSLIDSVIATVNEALTDARQHVVPDKA